MVVFRLLGPFWIGDRTGREVCLTARKQQILLAMLLLRRNDQVGFADLIEALWGDSPPASAKANLKTYAWNLNGMLPPALAGRRRIECARGGYRLLVQRNEIDLDQFTALFDAGRRSLRERPTEAVRQLGDAVRLWRGEPLDGLADVAALQPYIAKLNEEYWICRERHIEAQIAVGELEELLPEIRALTLRQPLREPLWSLLMMALCRSGRKAEALAAYRQVYLLFRDRLGLEPGPDLQRLQQQILRADPALYGDLNGTGNNRNGCPAVG